ncbi:MAG: ABC transporter ATP-binding protein [Elainellaceae cyanobacterium]
MKLRLPGFIWRLVTTTRYWRENRLILGEMKHLSHLLVLALLLPFLSAVFEGFSIGFLLAFLQTLVDPDVAPWQTGVAPIDDWILEIGASERSRLYRVSALILISTVLRSGCNYANAVCLEFIRTQLVNRLQKRLFEQLQALSLSFYSKVRLGEVLNTMTTEIGQLQQAIGLFNLIFTKIMVIAAYSVLAVHISWSLSLLAIALFGLTAVGIATLNRRLREISFQVSQTRGNFAALTTELISGMRLVQAFATQDFERQRFYQSSDEVAAMALSSTFHISIVRPIAEIAGSFILVGMLLLGMEVWVAHTTLTVASLLTFVFVLFRAARAVQEINGCLATLSYLQGPIQHIENLLRTDDKPYVPNGDRPFMGLQQAIEFVAVDFGYDSKIPVLQNISLTIPKGETLAIVGASGAGKSTLADLIPRFYDPIQGELRLDGVDIRTFDIASVRRKMAVVSQDTFIFNASVRHNIAYGFAEIKEQEVVQAARLANALDFIEELPHGFDTVLGDRGVRLSGGQRQRIAIARALLRNPEILILDEATSALDSVSERLIQKSLEDLAIGRTVIIIAHRLSTIIRADQIVVLEQGQIVEQGTYPELLARKGKLWKYHQMQYGSINLL